MSGPTENTPDSDSIPIADLSQPRTEPAHAESDSESVPIADLSETSTAETAELPQARLPNTDSVPIADLSETLPAGTCPPANPEADQDPDAASKASEEQRASELASEGAAPASAPSQEPDSPGADVREASVRRSGLLIASPVLVAPLLVGVLLAAGVPQRTLRRLSGADPFEPNDAIAEARDLGPGKTQGARCGPGDVDWFRVSIPPGKCLQLRTDPPPDDEGATSVHRLDGTCLASSSTGDSRCVYAPPGLTGETVAVRVWGVRSTPYDITLSFLDPMVRFEPNDQRALATPIELMRHDAIRGNGSDWFRVVVPAGRELRAKLDTQATTMGLRLVHTTSVAPVGTAGLAAEATLAPVGANRAVLVQVAGRGEYALDLGVGERAAPLAKLRSEAALPVIHGSLEPNNSQESAKPITEGMYPDLRCDGIDWYKLALPKNTTLILETRHNRSRGDLQLQLLIPQPNGTVPDLERGQWRDRGQRLHHYTAEATDAWVRIDNGRIPYRLNVQLIEGRPGTPLGPGDYSDLVCSPEQVWRIPLEAGEHLEVELSYDSSEGWLEFNLYDESWASRGSSTSSSGRSVRTFNSKRDQSVFVQVTGPGIRYQLGVTVTPSTSTPFKAPKAELIGPGIYPARKVARETWYAISVREGEAFMAEASFKAPGDIDIELLDEDGKPVLESATTDSVEHILYTFERAQLVYLRVYTFAPEPLDYELRLAINDETTPREGARAPLRPGTYAHSEGTGNDMFPVELEAGQRLSAEITFSNDEGDLDLALHDGGGRERGVSRTEEDREQLLHTAPTRETVYLRVFGAKSGYQLSVAIE